MCRCQRCEKPYGMDLMIPDEVWAKIMSSNAGMLCPTCIVRALECLAPYSVYFVREDNEP